MKKCLFCHRKLVGKNIPLCDRCLAYIMDILGIIALWFFAPIVFALYLVFNPLNTIISAILAATPLSGLGLVDELAVLLLIYLTVISLSVVLFIRMIKR